MLARMLLRILIILAALLLPARALADDHAADLSGHWALRIDDATIFVFSLEQAAGGGWQGTWTRPVEIDSNGAVFRRMSGRETVQPIEVLERGGVVQLAFAGPQPGDRRDILQFRQVSENQASLTYIGIPGDPYPLVRVAPDTPLGPFEDVRIYDRDNAVVEADYAAELDASPQVAEAETEAVEVSVEEDMTEPAPALADSAGAAPVGEVDWQPLGLVDEQAAAAAATQAGLELEPLDEVELAEAEPADADAEAGDEDEEGDEDDAPRITADFLDGL